MIAVRPDPARHGPSGRNSQRFREDDPRRETAHEFDRPRRYQETAGSASSISRRRRSAGGCAGRRFGRPGPVSPDASELRAFAGGRGPGLVGRQSGRRGGGTVEIRARGEYRTPPSPSTPQDRRARDRGHRHRGRGPVGRGLSRRSCRNVQELHLPGNSRSGPVPRHAMPRVRLTRPVWANGARGRGQDSGFRE